MGFHLKIVEDNPKGSNLNAQFYSWFGNSTIRNKDGSPKVVYHGTTPKHKNDPDFDEFEPSRGNDIGSHFGTEHQATAIVSNEDGTPKELGRIYPCYMRMEKPLRMPDNITWDIDSMGDFLVQKKIITPEEYTKWGKQFGISYIGATNSPPNAPELRKEISANIIKAIQAKGYDGIIYVNKTEMSKEDMRKNDSAFLDLTDSQFLKTFKSADYSYCIFEPNQVKSIYNNGAWSMTSKKLFEDEFQLNSLDHDKQDELYQAFKHSYEKSVGVAWNRQQFDFRATDWTFFGSVKGGVGVRVQRSGLVKLNAVYGSPREIIKGMQELMSTWGEKPMWTVATQDIIAHLKTLGFKSPPVFVMKMLVPLFSKAMGAEIKSIGKDGALQIDTISGEHSKYFTANKNYYKWLVTNEEIKKMLGKTAHKIFAVIKNLF